MIDGFSVLVMEMRRGNVVVMLMRSKGRDVCTVCNGILFLGSVGFCFYVFSWENGILSQGGTY